METFFQKTFLLLFMSENFLVVLDKNLFHCFDISTHNRPINLKASHSPLKIFNVLSSLCQTKHLPFFEPLNRWENVSSTCVNIAAQKWNMGSDENLQKALRETIKRSANWHFWEHLSHFLQRCSWIPATTLKNKARWKKYFTNKIMRQVNLLKFLAFSESPINL